VASAKHSWIGNSSCANATVHLILYPDPTMARDSIFSSQLNKRNPNSLCLAVMAIAATALLKDRRCILCRANGSGRNGMPPMHLTFVTVSRARNRNRPGS
jgi:hypothetical protein